MLNESQSKACNERGHTLIVAGPGSGKTRLLAFKTLMLLDEGIKFIVITTFTKDSAKEIKNRIKEKYKSNDLDKRLLVGTFHSLSRKLLIQNNKIKPILNDADQIYLLTRVRESNPDYLQCDDNELLGQIENIKHAKISKTSYDSFYLDAFNKYNQLLEELDSMDFPNLIEQTTKFLMEGTIEPFMCEHLLVDEFQDTDQTQYEWIKQHKNKGTIVTVVGDDDQSIYGWRNALGTKGLVQFEKDYHPKLVILDINYRSKQEILDASNKLISNNEQRINKLINSHRGNGGKSVIVNYSSKEEELTDMTNTVANNPDDWAILLRTKSKMLEIAYSLSDSNIPFTLPDNDSIFNNPISQQFINILSISTMAYPLALEKILHWQGIRDSGIKTIKQATINMDGNNLTKLQYIKNNPDKCKLNIYESTIVDSTISYLETVQADYITNSIASIVTKAVKWLTKLIYLKNKIEYAQAHIVTLDIAKDIILKIKGKTLEDKIYSALNPKENVAKSTGVKISTIHSSKGLQYKNVWIANASQGVMPHAKTDDIEEERRLMYVAITRAKDTVVMSGGNARQGPSQFLDEALTKI